MKKWIKQLGKDSLVYGIGGVVARGFGFFLLPIYTRIFSIADYGLIELITVVCMFAFAVIAGGTDGSLEFYFTERAEEGPQTQARVVTSVLLWRVVWGGVVVGIVLLLAPLLNTLLQYDIPITLLAIATTSVFLAGLTGPMLSVFRLLFKPWWYVGISLLGTVAAAATTIVLVVRFDRGVMGALIGACVGAAMVSVLGLWGVRQYLSWQPQFRQWWPRLLRFGLPLMPTALALYVLNFCDRFFIVRFHGDDALGLYSVGAKFALIISLMVITAIVASMVIRGNRPLRSGFTLATAFANGGNMGIPVAFLAFGELGLAVAIIVFVTHATISWPVGIYIAAHGRANGFAALRQALQVPTIYAVPLALGMRAGGWSLPDPLSRPIELMGQAAVPVMLVLLGFQLAQGMDIARWRGIAASAAIRLVLSAAMALVATEVAGLEGTAQHTVIVVSAMPTAVFTTILAAEFDAEPRFVSSAMVFSTLISLVTLTALITLLGWWV